MKVVHSMGKKILKFIMKFWWILLILLAVAGYVYYQRSKQLAATEVKTYTVKRDTLEDVLALSGEMNASEEANLHFQSGGRLSWVGVKEGDYIKKNQGIASLDQRQLQKTLQKYLNTYDSTRKTFDQTNDDNDTLTLDLSKEVRDRASRVLINEQNTLNNSVLDVELQSIAKEYAYLYSPIEGVVTRVDAQSAGQNVAVTDIYQVINPKSLYFSISADQTEVVKLHEGLPGTITLDAFPDETFNGYVTAISFTPRTDETGTVYEVKMSVDTPNLAALRLAMTGDVEFVLKQIPNAIAVPFEYIDETDEGSFVNKKVGSEQKRVAIKTGVEYDGLIEVTDGLVAGDVLYEISN